MVVAVNRVLSLTKTRPAIFSARRIGETELVVVNTPATFTIPTGNVDFVSTTPDPTAVNRYGEIFLDEQLSQVTLGFSAGKSNPFIYELIFGQRWENRTSTTNELPDVFTPSTLNTEPDAFGNLVRSAANAGFIRTGMLPDTYTAATYSTNTLGIVAKDNIQMTRVPFASVSAVLPDFTFAQGSDGQMILSPNMLGLTLTGFYPRTGPAISRSGTLTGLWAVNVLLVDSQNIIEVFNFTQCQPVLQGRTFDAGQDQFEVGFYLTPLPGGLDFEHSFLDLTAIAA